MSRTREITMMVSKIESTLIEVTTYGGPERFTPGTIWIEAHGEGEFHSWQAQPGQRCWIGDLVTVTVIEDDAEPGESTPLTPRPIDKRT